MHPRLVQAVVAKVRQRDSEGDFPVTPSFPTGTLESALIALADDLDARAALSGASPPAMEQSDAAIRQMVERFLQWRLPDPWRPDNGIAFEPVGNPGTPYEFRRQPTGTNLFSYTQAEAMVRHMLNLPDPPVSK